MPRPDTLQLGALLHPAGGHVAGRQHPDADAAGGLDLARIARLARTLEDAGFSAILVADVAEVGGGLDALHRTAVFEPFTLLSALSSVTARIGLVAPATAAVDEPFTVARKLASLDHLSHGRAGWNVVTSGTPLGAADPRHDAHAASTERAAEFVEVVEGLWDGVEEGAMVRDQASGIYLDRAKRHALDHVGEHFRVAGPLNIARPPQGRPVLFRGAAETGSALVARSGEVLVTAPRSLQAAVAHRAALDAQLAGIGRDPGDVRVWPLLSPIVADTDADAEEVLATLGSLVHEDVLRRIVQDAAGDEDLSDLDLDEPLPDLGEDTDRSQRRRAGILGLAREEGLTLRRLGVRIAAGGAVAGSAATIADRLVAWHASGAIDGFTVSFPFLPGPADRFVAEVLPLLQQRGVFRPPAPGTLREQLGLPVPSSGSAARA